MKQIIIINGTGGCGKDTFVNLCSKYAKVVNFSSVAKVKEVASSCGWDGSKTEKDRKFLSDLKKLTTKYNDMAYNSVVKAIKIFNASNEELLFIHIKEPEEIKRVVENYNAKSLLIKKEGLEKILSNESDANIDKYNYDYVIINKDLDNLEEEAKIFVRKIESI